MNVINFNFVMAAAIIGGNMAIMYDYKDILSIGCCVAIAVSTMILAGNKLGEDFAIP